MRDTKAVRTARLFERLARLGFSFHEADTLRRIEMTLSRWSAQECGDSNEYGSWAIERDGEAGDGKPFMVSHSHRAPFTTRREPIADRERGALRRLHAIMASHPGVLYYHQSDPRGCALYLIDNRERRITSDAWDRWVECNYTQGVAVCI